MFNQLSPILDSLRGNIFGGRSKLHKTSCKKRVCRTSAPRRQWHGFESLEDRLLLAIDPLGGQFRVNTSTTGYQTAVSVDANASGDGVAVWQSSHLENSSDSDVFLQRYNAEGSPLGPEVRVNPDWHGDQTTPDVAVADDGTFVVTWSTSNDGSGWGVQAQRFAADGSPVGSVFGVNSETAGDQSASEVAIDGDSGEFVVVWTSADQDGSNNGVFGQRYAADGTPEGIEFQVNTYINSHQENPTVAMDSAGNFVVAWQSNDQDGSNYGVYGQRYAADGTPEGIEFRVNTDSYSNQFNPALAMDAAGDFVVTWESYSQDGSGYGVFGQRYGTDGTPLGNEFQVNTYTSGGQVQPNVAMNSTGSFVVAWASSGQDGSNAGVYAQQYAADGTAVDGEVSVNTTTSGSQDSPAVAFGEDGDLLIAFEHQGSEIYGQFYGEGLAQPDLVPVKVSAPNGANLGQAINVSAMIRNQGGLDAGSFACQYYLSADQVITNEDTPVGGLFNVSGLTGGSYHTDSRQLQVPLDAPTGDLHLGLLVDVNDEVTEEDDDNNGSATSGFPLLGVRQPPSTVGGQFTVNSCTNGIQTFVSLDTDVAGNYVAVWQGPNENGLGTSDIFLQRYNAEGSPLGPEVRVNPDWHGDQTDPDVAVADDGTFVVTWSTSDDGSGWGVQAQRFAADGSPVGSVFGVNSETAGDQSASEVAIDGDSGEFVVVWTSADQDGSNNGVFGQRYAADGTPEGIEFQVNTYINSHQENPTVAMDSAGNFVVAWQSNDQDGSNYGVYGQRYAADGTPEGIEFRVNTYTYSTQLDPALAMDSAGNFVVTWESYSQDGSGDGVYGQRYGTDGTPLGDEFQVNTYTSSNQRQPDVAMNSTGSFVVAWASSGQDTAYTGVYAQQYAADGTAVGGEFRVTAPIKVQQDAPAVAFAEDGDFLITFAYGGGDIYGQLYGERLTQPDLVPVKVSVPNGANQGQTINASAKIRNQGSVDAGAFACQYYLSADAQITTGDTPLGDPITIDGLTAYTTHTDSQTFAVPDVAEGDWYVGIIVDTDDGVVEADDDNNAYESSFNEPTVNIAPFPMFGPQQRANTTTAEDQSDPAIAFDSTGDYVTVWQDESLDGSGYGIYGQRFDDSGSPVGNEFQINSTHGGNQKTPSVVVAPDGRFVVTWQSDGQDGSGWGVYAQRFAEDGSAVGAEFLVNTYTTSDQDSPTVAIDADGNFVVVWHSQGQDTGNNGGIYGQRYLADGTPDGPEFWVCSTPGPDQIRPAVRMNASGQFIVVWDDGTTIYARRFLSNGTAAGDEFVVNTYGNSNQTSPALAMDAAGNFVVAWQSYGQDSSDYGVYGQRYGDDGTPQGEEFKVNTYTDSCQYLPSVSMDSASGEFVITWSSNGQDGSEYGVFAQRYAADGSTVGGEFRVNRVTYTAQTASAVAMLDAQHFVIAWQSYLQDGSDCGIYTQHVGASDENSRPDLGVSALSVPGSIHLNETVDVTLSIQNTGMLVAPTSTAHLWLSDDNVFDDGNDLDTGIDVPLPQVLHNIGNNTYQTTVSYIWPSTDPFGTDSDYYFILEADSGSIIDEISETNNARASNLVELRMPDLSGSVSVPSSIEPGQQMSVDVSIRNDGDAGAPASVAHLWISDDEVVGNADDIDLSVEIPVPELQTYSWPDYSYYTFQTSVDHTWPLTDPFDTDGQYYFILKMDANNAIVESDEENNEELSASFGVSRPNLIVNSLTAPSQVDAGQQVTVSLQVINTGTAEAGPSTLHVWLSDDATGGNADDHDLLIDVPVPSLGLSGWPDYDSFVKDVTFTWPAEDPFGTDLQYHVVARADAAGEVDEGNEEDNWGVSQVVRPRVPDLEGLRLWTPSTVQNGQHLIAFLEIRNAGLLTTVASTAHVWLSDNEVFGDADDIELAPPLDVAIPELAGNDRWSTNVTIPWPEVDPFGTDSEYFVGIQLDYLDEIEEGNESNNVLVSEPLALVTPMPLDIQFAGHLGGASLATAIHGDYVYELTSAGLRVLDASDPTDIMRLSEVVFPVSWTIAIHVEGDRLYQADYDALRVFDVSAPHLPVLLSEQSVEGVTAAAFDGDVAFLVDVADLQLDIVDLTDPENLTVLSEYDLRGDAWGIAVEGSMAYISYNDPGFDKAAIEVVDVSDLSNPTFVSRRSMNHYGAGSIDASGDLLAVVEESSFVVLVDVSDPALPRIRGEYAPPNTIQPIDLSGNTLQVGTQNSYQEQFLTIIDVSDPADPAEIGVIEVPFDLGSVGAGTLTSAGTLTYVAGGALNVIDVSDRFNPTLLGSYAEPWGLDDIAIAGTTACMTSEDRLELFDVSEPAVPRHVGTYTASQYIDKVITSGGHVLLVEGMRGYQSSQIEVLDISDPANPVLLERLTIDTGYDYLLDAVADGGRLHLLSSNSAWSDQDTGGFSIVDISDPGSPVLLSTTGLSVDGYYSRLFPQGDRLFVSNSLATGEEPNDTLATAYELGDLAGPVVVPAVVGPAGDVDYYHFVGMAGDVVNIAMLVSGVGTLEYCYLELRNASDSYLTYDTGSSGPDALIANFTLPYTGDYYIRARGSYSWATGSYQLAVASNAELPPAADAGGVSVFSISDPSAPALLSTLPTEKLIEGMFADDSNVYLSFNAPALLEVWDFSDPANPARGGSAQIAEAGPIVVSGSLASIAAGNRMQVVDVGNPEYPVTLESYQTGWNVTGFAVEGVVTFMAADSLYAFSIQPEGAEAPDLAVTGLTTDPAVELGSTLDVGWTVRNHGQFAATGTWTDRVYLSADAVWDAGDVPLAYAGHTGPLDSLDSYTEQVSAAVSGVATGYYYVIVRADVDDDVDEWFVESNNTRVSAQPIYVGYPDLDITHIGVPEVAERGDLLPVQWTVHNRDFAPANGSWIDEVYLSEDDTFSPGVDQLVGTASHSSGLNARTVYRAGFDVDTASFVGDAYYVIVRTDTGNVVFEDDREANNILISDGPFRLGVPALAVDTPLVGTFDFAGQSKYYRVEVDAGDHLFVSLDDLNDAGYNELYIKYGSAPSRSDYDARYSANLAADQIVEIPNAFAGTYYVLAHADSAPDAPADYALTAYILDFQILGIAPNYGGNVGPVTVTIRGANYPEDAAVVLVSPTGTELSASKLVQPSNELIHATFDLTGVEIGQYDVRVDGPVLSTSIEDIFVVSAGIGATLEVDLITPSAFRVSREGRLWIDYRNTGDADVVAPLISVSTGLGNIRLDGGGWTDSVQVLGINHGGPAGVLPPGASGRIRLHFLANGTGTAGLSLGFAEEGDAEIDWAGQKADMKPDDVSSEAWDVIFDNFSSQLGSTTGEYVAALAETATYLGQLGENVVDVGRLQSLMLQQANNSLGQQSLGSAVDAYTPAPAMPLIFARSYQQSISSRFEVGALGCGWTDTTEFWDMSFSATDVFDNQTMIGDFLPQFNGPRPLQSVTIDSPNGSRTFYRVPYFTAEYRQGEYRAPGDDAAIVPICEKVYEAWPGGRLFKGYKFTEVELRESDGDYVHFSTQRTDGCLPCKVRTAIALT